MNAFERRGENIMELNRTHLILLSILGKSQATSVATAITNKEIERFCPLGKSYATLHRAISFLNHGGYIAQGIKDGKFNTHYITQLGIELLKEVQ
jgi:hypothetical protein